MANRVSVDISANVTGYKTGIDQATKSTQKYETEQRKVRESTVNLNSELRRAKKEAMSLGAAYAQLSAEEKRSQFGLEMKRQLDAAMESAAEFIDLQGDLREQMKNLASDTRVLDTMAEGIGVIGDVTSTALGIFAQFTGESEDAQRALVAFTTAQSALGAVTKITNALQMQSNTMLAITKLQTLAAAAASKIKTAADSRGIIVTKAATVAQALFNKVAMANPYVLLATAILTVVAALTAFIAFTHEAEDAEEEETKAAERAKSVKDAYYDAYNQNLAETMANYTSLRNEWVNLKTEGEKTQWISDNSDKFNELGFEIRSIADAERVFVTKQAAVVQSFIARAEAAALAAQAAMEFQKALEGVAQEGELHSAEWFQKKGININNRKPVSGNTWLWDNRQFEVTKADREKMMKEALDQARKNTEELGKMQLAAEERAQAEIARAGVRSYNRERQRQLRRTNNRTGSGGGHGRSVPDKQEVKIEPEVDPHSLAAAEAALKELEDKRIKMNVDDPELEVTKEAIRVLQEKIKQMKIKLGIEVETTITAKDELDEYEKELQDAANEALSELIIADLNQDDISKILDLADAYDEAKKALKAYQDVRDKWSSEEPAGQGSEFLHKALKGDIDKSIDAISNAISELETSLSKKTDFSSMGKGDDTGATFDEYIAKIQEYKAELASLQEVYDEAMLTPQEKLQKKLEKTSERISQIAEAVQAAGDMFSALGELADNEGLQVAGIVAKAVATVALSYAQALTTCKTWVDWLAFGLAGLGTMISMISSIKSATSGYAEGGIVGGSSYGGDKLFARLNSGEMVLNNRQQRNLFNLLDGNAMPGNRTNRVEIVGKIKGTDLLLVQKNTNKMLSKAHSAISIN